MKARCLGELTDRQRGNCAHGTEIQWVGMAGLPQSAILRQDCSGEKPQKSHFNETVEGGRRGGGCREVKGKKKIKAHGTSQPGFLPVT